MGVIVEMRLYREKGDRVRRILIARRVYIAAMGSV